MGLQSGRSVLLVVDGLENETALFRSFPAARDAANAIAHSSSLPYSLELKEDRPMGTFLLIIAFNYFFVLNLCF